MRLHPRDRRLIVGAPGQRLDGPRPDGRWIRQPLGHQPGADIAETIEQSEPQERRRVVQRQPPETSEPRFKRMDGLVREEAGRMPAPSLPPATAPEHGRTFPRNPTTGVLGRQEYGREA